MISEGAFKALHHTKEPAHIFFEGHLSGLWRAVCEEDRERNDQQVKIGGGVMSVFYLLDGIKICVISDPADGDGTRPSTTLLLPDEDYELGRCASFRTVVSDVELRRQYVPKAYAELVEWRNRYKNLQELAELFGTIDKIKPST